MIMYRYLFIIIMLFSLSVFGQKKNVNIDSLNKINSTLPDTQQIKNYFDICRYWVGADKNKSIEAAQKAVKIAEKLKSDLWISKSLTVLAATFSIHGEYENLISLGNRSITHALKSGDKPTIMNSYIYQGSNYGLSSNWDMAIEATDKGLSFAKELKDTIGMINAYNMIALCNLYMIKYNLAEQYHFKALELSKAKKRTYELARAYSGLAELYVKKTEWNKAIKFSRLGTDVFIKMNYNVGVAQSKIYEAISWYELGKLSQSKLACKKIVDVITSQENSEMLAEANNLLGKIAMEEDKLNDAKNFLNEALKLAQNLKSYKLLKEIYHNMESLYRDKKQFDIAKEFRRKSEIAADSLFSEKALLNVVNYQVKYETAKKEEQLAIEKEKRTRLLFGSALALILLGSFFLYLRNKQIQKQKQTKLEAENSKLQAVLEHAEADRLREIDKMKSNFFANISHEFRTPLSLIVSPLEQMISGSFKGDKEKYFGIMLRNAKRLLELINQLLDLSKLESGKVKLSVQQGNISKLIKFIVFSHQSLADKKSIQFQIHKKEQDSIICYFDKDKVEKILSNLISNAIKFSADNTIIDINYTYDANKIILSVTDHGIGIAEDQLSQIFERFGKSSISELQPGSGIGLAITKELVELHGGSISAKSKEGVGSTFTININVHKNFFKDDEVSTELMEEYDSVKKTAFALNESEAFNLPDLSVQNKVILIVEDNADVRSYLRDQLRENYTILEADNGKQGITLSESSVPDMIITDVMMPEMNGYEFCKKIKTSSVTSHIPVIMLTAKADQKDKLSGFAYGADDYLTKPFDATELMLKLKNLMNHQDKLRKHLLESFTSITPSNLNVQSMDAIFIRDVKETIESNLEDETFSVVELGHKIGVSRSQLHKKLTALTGLGPNEIIRNMRLERAKQLLKQKSGTIAEIAYQSGFNSPAYFIKCFKDYFGKTPGEIK